MLHGFRYEALRSLNPPLTWVSEEHSTGDPTPVRSHWRHSERVGRIRAWTKMGPDDWSLWSGTAGSALRPVWPSSTYNSKSRKTVGEADATIKAQQPAATKEIRRMSRYVFIIILLFYPAGMGSDTLNPLTERRGMRLYSVYCQMLIANAYRIHVYRLQLYSAKCQWATDNEWGHPASAEQSVDCACARAVVTMFNQHVLYEEIRQQRTIVSFAYIAVCERQA